MSPMLFGSKNSSKEEGWPASSFVNEPWYIDLQKLTNEELMRMYTMISDGHYRFAKNAWYIPIEKDHRCPIMVAKGYRSPDTLDRMAEFQDTAKMLESDFLNFIDAWDFGHITEQDIEKAILKILESRNIAITEHS
ncbi:MAG TPA: hypothetical protein VFH28_06930 [Nitrososphaera sp.]|jgi:hypothetical protein|nr:hypothetical protein [Nitrososphaera sp.]